MKIETERLTLREVCDTDFADIHEYASDYETTYFLGWGPNDEQTTRSFMNAWFESYAKTPRRDFDFAVCNKNGVFLGVVWINADEMLADGSIGWIIKKQHRRKGYALEAARALVQFCFDTLKLHRIHAKCDTQNHASYAIMQRLGMRREAHFRKSWQLHGEWRDEYLYALLSDEWTETADS